MSWDSNKLWTCRFWWQWTPSHDEFGQQTRTLLGFTMLSWGSGKLYITTELAAGKRIVSGHCAACSVTRYQSCPCRQRQECKEQDGLYVTSGSGLQYLGKLNGYNDSFFSWVCCEGWICQCTRKTHSGAHDKAMPSNARWEKQKQKCYWELTKFSTSSS